ncbi:MAG TPA: hypothetical protein VIL86_08255, partial [Tepidisphaeraceae bacterium]
MRQGLAQQSAMTANFKSLFSDAAEDRRQLRTMLRSAQRQLQQIRTAMDEAARERQELNRIVIEVRDQIASREMEVQTVIHDLQNGHVAQQTGADKTAHAPYRQLIKMIREKVAANVPERAAILMVSKGDEMMLRHPGRRAWHFPQDHNGVYAGYHPYSSASAIAHLEAMRAKGAQFLVIPETYLWWLEHYREFARHLQNHYRVVLNDASACMIYDLDAISVDTDKSAPEKGKSIASPSGPSAFEDALTAFRSRFDREPSVLDWDSGLNLAANFPECAVFSPEVTEGDVGLPYLDASVDIVAAGLTGDSSAEMLAESRR